MLDQLGKVREESARLNLFVSVIGYENVECIKLVRRNRGNGVALPKVGRTGNLVGAVEKIVIRRLRKAPRCVVFRLHRSGTTCIGNCIALNVLDD
jgi:hypothetical protein